MIKIIIPLNPVTKKNSQRIKFNSKTKKPFIVPSEIFMKYQKHAGWFLANKRAPEGKLNICAHYYREKKGTVDLINLHAALHDVLVHYEVIKDDSVKYIIGTDGSRVFYDAKNPRTEIFIKVVEE